MLPLDWVGSSAFSLVAYIKKKKKKQNLTTNNALESE